MVVDSAISSSSNIPWILQAMLKERKSSSVACVDREEDNIIRTVSASLGGKDCSRSSEDGVERVLLLLSGTLSSTGGGEKSRAVNVGDSGKGTASSQTRDRIFVVIEVVIFPYRSKLRKLSQGSVHLERTNFNTDSNQLGGKETLVTNVSTGGDGSLVVAAIAISSL